MINCKNKMYFFLFLTLLLRQITFHIYNYLLKKLQYAEDILFVFMVKTPYFFEDSQTLTKLKKKLKTVLRENLVSKLGENNCYK